MQHCYPEYTINHYRPTQVVKYFYVIPSEILKTNNTIL